MGDDRLAAVAAHRSVERWLSEHATFTFGAAEKARMRDIAPDDAMYAPDAMEYTTHNYVDAQGRPCFIFYEHATRKISITRELSQEISHSTNSITYADVFTLDADGNYSAMKVRTQAGCFHSLSDEIPLSVSLAQFLALLSGDLKPTKTEFASIPQSKDAASLAGWTGPTPNDFGGIG